MNSRGGEPAQKEYVTTEEQCRKMISGVCCGCGGKLVPIETVDNSRRPTFWSGCNVCGHFDSGVKLLAYRVASKLFEEGETAYHHLDRPGINKNEASGYADYYRREQTRGLSHMVSRVLALAALEAQDAK